MRKYSKSRQKQENELNKIKKNLNEFCVICGCRASDAAHLLPRSLFPEYISKEWNVVPMCRAHHDLYDSDVEFRQRQKKLFNQIAEHDLLAANRYFRF